ncbi:location of vulva defective 1 isoform X14 [Leptinotarsa decemlineata]|uniref:location of vulva defective 1 isoform X14 n=1 Tax=Leptinotarsa decemlineata TaxID=7539 RepID=UPI003D30A7F3
MTFACRYLEVKILLQKTTMLNLIFLLVPLNSAITFNESQMSQSVDWEILTSVEHKTKLEKYSRCGSDLNILDCDSPKQFSISEVNEIQSQYKTGNKCITTRLSSNWILIYENGTVQNLQHFQNEETLVIEPFSLGTGSYQALLYVEGYNENGIKDFLSKQCFFEIRPEQSIPVKVDGEKVSMNTDEEFILDSRDSIDPNVPPNHTETSHYEWRCNTSRRNRPDSCRQNLGSGTTPTIPDEYAVEGLIYNFRLSVGNKNSVRWKTRQIIEPRGRGGMLFNMHFLENCRPICDVEKKIVFEAMCEANCERMNENATFFWTVDIPDFDYKTNTSGREGKQFTIKADVLEPDKKYKVGYKLKGDLSDGVFVDLLTHKGPKLRYCQLNPDIGTALVTDFHVICGQEPGSYTYKIYLVSDDVEFLLTTGTSLYDMPFHLNENSDIRIEIIDEYHFTDSVTVFAEVIKLPGQSQPDGKPNAEYIEGKYFNAAQDLSVFNLLSSNRTHQLLQTLNMLTDELPKLPNVTLNVLKEYHLKTLDILRKLPLDNKEVAKQVAAVTSKIAKQYESKSDPWTSEAITDVCQFGSNKYLGHVKDEKYVGMIADDIEKAVRMFSGCSRALEGENPEILQVQDTFVETTTPFVLVDFPVITEDYPDYVDDQNISKMLTKISEKSIYFLSDIPSSHRFGYLLIVKTGNKSGAGTTSNIVIKLYGKNSESKEHVLNFPDPEKRILQHNQEDWFFLATKLHLGEIEKLEIWFDSLGLRPSWYCSEIEVVDLQMNKYWWFNINYRFEIGDKENHFLTAVPESPPYVKKKRSLSFRKFSLHGCHMWNIFHDDEATISRTKRLTIMMSIFMTTYTIILFLYGCPKLQNSDSVGQYSEYGFHMHLLWTTLGGFAITFLIHMPIVSFFRFHQEEKYGEKVGLLGKYSFQINIFCWGLVIFLVIACMTTLLISGFWVPHVTALLWLTSTVVSLLIYIFLLENLVTIVYNFILRRTKRLVHISRRIKLIMASIEAQRAYIYRKFSENSLRSYYRHVYKPLDPARIKEQKHWAHIKESTFEIVEDLIMITIYVMLLYTVILKDKDPMTFLSNREAHDLIIGIHSRTIPKGHALFDRKEIQEYITNTLVFSMQSPQWYGKYVIKDPGMTIDNNNKYIGIARLRQLRSTNVSCMVVSPMEFVTQKCIHEFSEGPEYEDFSETWGHDENSDEFSRMDQVWNYNAYTVTGSFSYVGKFATYPGGGYVATLGRTMKNSLTNLNYIFRNKWIDRFTRCLFIEFLLYNSNSNLFQSIVIKFEISTSGFIRTKFNVNSARLLFVKEKTGLLLTILLFCFVLMIIILSVKLVLKLVRKKKKIVFKDLWHIVDIIIIMISMACLFLYMERTLLVKRFLERIEKAKHNEFVNYFHLFFAETALTSLAAVLVFIATLRLWKLLKFLLIIKIAEKTLTSSLGPIASIFLYHMLTIFIFTLVGMVFFGDQSNDFKDLLDSAVTLLLMSLSFHQDFDFSSLKTPLHQSYYSFYMLISLFFLTLYVAIITISYAEAQVFYSKGQGYDVFDYLKEQYQYYKEVAEVKLRNSRIRGGEEDGSEVRKWVFPKADVHRYANCLTLPKNKTNAMVYVTLAILRSMKRNQKLTADDEKLIKLMIVHLFREDSEENDFFFISHAKPGKATLVDDLVFLKMEKVLTVLFSNRGKHKEQLYEKLLENTENKLEKMSYNLSVLMNSLDRIDFRVED